MPNTEIYASLDIGTSKICMIVAELQEHNKLQILGHSAVTSKGIQRGDVVDFAAAKECVHKARLQAEEISNVNINSVFLSLSGDHLKGLNNSGSQVLPNGIIKMPNIEQVHKNACNLELNVDSMILNFFSPKYNFNNCSQLTKPLDMNADSLSVKLHIIKGSKKRISNSVRLINENCLQANDIVFSPIANGQWVLQKNEKEHGALVIDIGAGTTDYALYLDGCIVASGCIPAGGDFITNDICSALPHLNKEEADELKMTEGHASIKPQFTQGTIPILDAKGFQSFEIERFQLNAVIHARLKQVFELVYQGIEKYLNEEILHSLQNRIILTGGVSQTQGIYEVIYSVFFNNGHDLTTNYDIEEADIMPKNNKYFNSLSLKDQHPCLRDPSFTAALGLIQYAQIYSYEQRKKENSHLLAKLTKKMRNWLEI